MTHNLNLGTLVDMVLMGKYANLLGVSQMALYCGYLRKPIYTKEESETQVQVSGMCIFNNERCTKVLPRQSIFVYDDCPVYNKRINKGDGQ